MEITTTISGINCNIGQIPWGEHADKWCWSTDDAEGKPCDSCQEAVQDAKHYFKTLDDQEADQREADEEARIYGSYDDQVRADYRANINLGRA